MADQTAFLPDVSELTQQHQWTRSTSLVDPSDHIDQHRHVSAPLERAETLPKWTHSFYPPLPSQFSKTTIDANSTFPIKDKVGSWRGSMKHRLESIKKAVGEKFDSKHQQTASRARRYYKEVFGNRKDEDGQKEGGKKVLEERWNAAAIIAFIKSLDDVGRARRMGGESPRQEHEDEMTVEGAANNIGPVSANEAGSTHTPEFPPQGPRRVSEHAHGISTLCGSTPLADDTASHTTTLTESTLFPESDPHLRIRSLNLGRPRTSPKPEDVAVNEETLGIPETSSDESVQHPSLQNSDEAHDTPFADFSVWDEAIWKIEQKLNIDAETLQNASATLEKGNEVDGCPE
ncbi:hypothetical protein N0V90_005595 [Kalmusia sp. IMI 367209]|nr:hypothetical protein N0V90_005595 [Kalmusia sp. IMI 367209]